MIRGSIQSNCNWNSLTGLQLVTEAIMAVQQNKKTRSRRGMRRAHDSLDGSTLTVDQTSGETRRRHHVSADGFYRGKKVLNLGEDD